VCEEKAAKAVNSIFETDPNYGCPSPTYFYVRESSYRLKFICKKLNPSKKGKCMRKKFGSPSLEKFLVATLPYENDRYMISSV